jgi:hypothetical protein
MSDKLAVPTASKPPACLAAEGMPSQPASAAPAHRAPGFPYDEAFSRNIGWVTHAEQQTPARPAGGDRRPGRRRWRAPADAGASGCRESTGLPTSTRFDFANLQPAGRRLGVGDRPDQVPGARRHGARHSIPMPRSTSFSEGVTASNVDAFLEGVDLYVDGLDFFAFDARQAVFNACSRKGIPAITVAPLGMGAALLNFSARPDELRILLPLGRLRRD